MPPSLTSAWRGLARLIVVCALLPCAQAARSESIAILYTDRSAPHQEVAQALLKGLGAAHPGWSTRLIPLPGSGTPTLPAQTDLVVALGVNAMREAGALPTALPTLVLMVPGNTYEAQLKHAVPADRRALFGAIQLDQPVERQLRAIHLALPHVRRVGVVTGPGTQGYLDGLRQEAGRLGLRLVARHARVDEEVMPAWREITDEADILLLLHEPLLLQQGRLQALLLHGYRARVPVFAYSESLVEAGALMALFSDPAQIAAEAVAFVDGHFAGRRRLSAPRNPTTFKIAANPWVARSLDIALPDTARLSQRIEASERP